MRAERRVCPLTGAVVFLSTARARRPEEWREWKVAPEPGFACPFCPGRESETPPEAAAGRPPGSAANGPGWRYRVFPNRYPAWSVEATLAEEPPPPAEAEPAVGRHEVIVETPRHELRFADLGVEALVELVTVWRDRVRLHAGDPEIEAIVIFRNAGPRSGASLSHPHGQLAALSRAPPRVAKEVRRARERRRRDGRCPVCEMLQQETRRAERIVARLDDFALLCPYASRFAGELWVVPERHPRRFDEIDDRGAGAFARALLDAHRRLDRVFGNPDSNLLFVAWVRGEEVHWRAEWVPRLSGIGGFELAAGATINGLPPEEAARRLRDVP